MCFVFRELDYRKEDTAYILLFCYTVNSHQAGSRPTHTKHSLRQEEGLSSGSSFSLSPVASRQAPSSPDIIQKRRYLQVFLLEDVESTITVMGCYAAML